MTLWLAEDLLDARVGDARSVGHGAVRVAVADSVADTFTPRLVRLAAVDGEAAEGGQAARIAHLEGCEVAEHLHVGPDDDGGAEARVAVGPRLAEGLTGTGGEPFPLRLGHAVEVVGSGHVGRILASGALVKREFLA